jgi:hypothetical protein
MKRTYGEIATDLGLLTLIVAAYILTGAGTPWAVTAVLAGITAWNAIEITRYLRRGPRKLELFVDGAAEEGEGDGTEDAPLAPGTARAAVTVAGRVEPLDAVVLQLRGTFDGDAVQKLKVDVNMRPGGEVVLDGGPEA